MLKQPMARPPAGKCVHCLADPVERDWDHVFPQSWYPEETPENIEKWKVPSCIDCNSRYGRMESDLLSRLILSLDPEAPASRSVIDAAMRSMRPSAGRNDKDRRHRAARRQRILDDTRQGADIPEGGRIPGMGERWGRAPEDQIAVLVPADSLNKMAEKIVRGIFFVEDGKFIEPPYAIELCFLEGEAERFWKTMLDKFGKTYERLPGIVVRRAVTPEDGISSIFEILLWQQFRMYAHVTND